MSRQWDAGLADKANLPLAELRAYENIFNQLDPQSEGEINVTKFVRSGLGRATTGLTLSSRDLRRLFSALRQRTTQVGDPDHISLPVSPNEFLMALARPPFYRQGLVPAEISLVKQFADAVRTTAGYSLDDGEASSSMVKPTTRVPMDSLRNQLASQRPPPPPAPPAPPPPLPGYSAHHKASSVSSRKGQRSGPFSIVVEDPEDDKYHKTFFQNLFDATAGHYFGGGAKPMSLRRALALMGFIAAISLLLILYSLHGPAGA